LSVSGYGAREDVKNQRLTFREYSTSIFLRRLPEMDSITSTTVAFVGLGAMGFGMASHLLKIGYHVIGYDVYEPTRLRFLEAGGNVSQSPREAARGAQILICMVANSQQADSVLFDYGMGAVEGTFPFLPPFSQQKA